MKVNSTEQLDTETQVCRLCGKKGHEWKEVYLEEKSRLKKAEKTLISWCPTAKQYVLNKLQ